MAASVKIDLFRYRLPLTCPLVLRQASLVERTGFLLRLAEDGLEGWGEAAPLSGFSRETEEAALDGLRKLRDTEDHSDAHLTMYPSSVRFAMECARLDLDAQKVGKTMAEMLAPKCASKLALNALVTTSGEQAVADASRRVGEGFTAVKLKVGRGHVEDDINTIRLVQNALPESVCLRLDGNRAWSFSDALRFARGIDPVTIEYIEEPLNEPERLEELADETSMPIALDESLVGLKPEDLVDHAYAKTIVLKPSIGGGLSWAAGMVKQARALGIETVVSNAFECGVGLRAHVALAAAWVPAPTGLSTYALFARDVFAKRLPLDGPFVHVREVLNVRALSLDRLDPIR